MTKFSLLLRNLRFFRLANLAVAAGMVVATAVLTGAMMVGDSVRGSLRKLTEDRLGRIDYVLVSGRFFPQSLAERISGSPKFGDTFDPVVAGISLRGGVSSDWQQTRVSGVQIYAISNPSLVTGPWVPIGPGQCVLSGELAGLLQVFMVTPPGGGPISVNLPAVDDPFREATLARRSRSDTTKGLARLPEAGVVRGPGVATLFNLAGGQRTPKNLWVDLETLQDAVDQPGSVNLLMVGKKGQQDAGTTAELNTFLHRVLELPDYGLAFTKSRATPETTLGSSDTYLMPPIVEAAEKAAQKLGVPVRRVSTYLINTTANLSSGENPKDLHYAIAAGISSLDDGPIAADEIVLNQWTADHLGAKVGDRIRLDYFQRQANGDLAEVKSDREGLGLTFRVGRILPMTGLGADPTLAPVYKGLTDKKSMADWPDDIIKLNRSWVSKDDDAYWQKYKAAPKFFINLDTARKLWGGTFGDLTGLRIPADKADAFKAELLKQIDPASMGMAFRPIKAEQLAASSGGTDFAELFVSFSFFLILSAVLLVAMLFRLNIEQRARQVGLLAALGFGAKTLRRLALGEGLVVAIIGAAVGTAAAVGYTWLMVAGLRTWWVDAVGTKAMYLHVEPMTLAIGFASSVVIAAFAILWGVWRVGRTSASSLLAGAWGTETKKTRRQGKWAKRIGIGGVILGAALLAAGLAKLISPQEACLGGGTILLFAILTWLAGVLRPNRQHAAAALHSVNQLGIRNASRHTARSILTAGLISLATFALVIVASMRGGGPEDTSRRSSGAGGYNLILQADIPLLGDLGTRDGREKLGVRNPADPIWNSITFTSMRKWAGQDISCLNLTKPTTPTILAVPAAMANRPGDKPADHHAFTFARQINKTDNPWTLLDAPAKEADAIPVIADDETAQYILKLDLGKSIEITDGQGVKRKLELVATIAHSVFQSELLMGESNFRKLFPSQSGFGTVLMETKPADADAVRKLLTTELDDYAVTVDRTADRLAMYAQVANTYMATFQTLGSLGLLLGTIGLAVVLLRGLVERRSELAMLAALGFRRASRLRLVLAENAFLLVIGLVVGGGCAVAAVLPAIFGSGRNIHLVSLGLTLGAVLATGLVALVLAVWFGGRNIGPADLRAE